LGRWRSCNADLESAAARGTLPAGQDHRRDAGRVHLRHAAGQWHRDKAWGLEATSRLSCQAKIRNTDLVIEIPKYTINMAKEGKS
jgi:hypothetical protein